jgi:hypothetical protein
MTDFPLLIDSRFTPSENAIVFDIAPILHNVEHSTVVLVPR